MNEFLQNLRTNSKRNSKKYQSEGMIGNHVNERRSGNERRLRASRPSGVKEETLITLKESIDEMHITLQEQVLFSERAAEAQERQADAFYQLVDIVSLLVEKLDEGSFSHNEAPVSHQVEMLTEDNLMMTPEEADAIKKTSRTYILSLIEQLRINHKTYEEVALYLTENNFPTFSGRGKWHAQTIHRLCQEIKKAKEKKNRK